MTLPDDEFHDARVDGKYARRAGKPNGANPYPPGSNEGHGWANGWRGEDRFIASGGVAGIHRREAARRRLRGCTMAPFFDELWKAAE